MSLRVRKRSWILRLARRYARRRLARAFDGVHVYGLDHARAALEREPLVIAANHVAYWDAFVVVLLDAQLAADGFALMDAQNLRRLPFFAWLGALPIDRSRARAAIADLDAAATLLDRPGRALWIFPQGRQRPAHLRPLGLQRGIERIARRHAVLPLALNYFYAEAPEPRVVASFGERLEPRASLATIERSVVDELARIDDFALHGQGFARVLAPERRSALPIGGRLLARGGEHA